MNYWYKSTISYLPAITSIIFSNLCFAQSDSLAVYTVGSGNVEYLPPVFYDAALQESKINSYTGSLPSVVQLPAIPPVSPVFSVTQFSTLQRASQFFAPAAYPARTAVKVIMYINGHPGVCSGIMVSNRHVLTAAHCLFYHSSASWADSILIAPAFDNGDFQPGLPVSKVARYFVFKSFTSNNSWAPWSDLGMLELNDPIGEQTGYVGIGFNNNDTFFSDRIFHKLSYPGVADMHNPANIYNGDTLYYQYGFIDVMSAQFLGINQSSAYGIPGQSGSSFFTEDQNSFTTYGVASYSAQLRHARIISRSFHQLKQVIDTALVNGSLPEIDNAASNLYPNPFQDKAVLSISETCDNCSLIVYSTEGRTVKTITNISGNRVTINRDHLKSGIYFYQLLNSTTLLAKGKLVAN